MCAYIFTYTYVNTHKHYNAVDYRYSFLYQILNSSLRIKSINIKRTFHNECYSHIYTYMYI